SALYALYDFSPPARKMRAYTVRAYVHGSYSRRGPWYDFEPVPGASMDGL
uniref:Glycolactin (Fragments) n=1 Tax=Bos taurus TaxID=9913 RepID=GLYL_BOVIN|nr:RecName: Full=Glycolactin [Bos taurus]